MIPLERAARRRLVGRLLLLERVPTLLAALSLARNLIVGRVQAAADRSRTLIRDDSLLFESAQIINQLFVFLLQLVVLFCQTLDHALLLLRLDLSLLFEFAQVAPQLVDFFSLLFRSCRNKLEVFLALLQRFLLLAYFLHFCLLHAIHFLGSAFSLRFQVALLSLDLAEEVIVVRFLFGQRVVVHVVPLDRLL